MCNPIVFAVMAVAGAVMQAGGEYQQAQGEKQVAKNNAKTAEYQAQDAIRRGDEQAAQIRREAGGVMSAQRASLGGRGVDVGFGTASDIQDQTNFFGEWDAQTARLNAQKDAWTLRRQRDNFLMQRDSIHPMMTAGGSLLSSIGMSGMSSMGGAGNSGKYAYSGKPPGG